MRTPSSRVTFSMRSAGVLRWKVIKTCEVPTEDPEAVGSRAPEGFCASAQPDHALTATHMIVSQRSVREVHMAISLYAPPQPPTCSHKTVHSTFPTAFADGCKGAEVAKANDVLLLGSKPIPR